MSQNKNNKLNYHNFVRIVNKQINYSFSQKNLNNSNHSFINNINNNYNIKLNKNTNLDKIRKNNFRKDSYCSSIVKKRKALGLEFKPHFERELSIQTEKNTEKKKKILDKIKSNNAINDNKCLNSLNNMFDKNKFIKVRKRDEYKKVEKRFKFLKKSIEREDHIHKMIKNKTTTNFNYNKKKFKFKKRNENELRNNTIKYDNINIFDNNDNISNKTIDNCINNLINKTLKENK